MPVKPQSTFHEPIAPHDSLRFDLDGKTGVIHQESSISVVCKGSIMVSYGVCSVSARFV